MVRVPFISSAMICGLLLTRHSAATLLLSAGVHPKIVQEIPGHSQISMTLDVYSHVLPTMQIDAMNKLNDAI